MKCSPGKHIDTGADMIFPDRLTSLQELDRCVKNRGSDSLQYVCHQRFFMLVSQLEEMGVAISQTGGLLPSAKTMWDYAQAFTRRANS
jgi:2-methylisocitrate lyase-like PEP mutase family enzyme